MKRRSTFAILFYINRTKIRRDGTCQILCKISVDGLSAQVGLGAYVPVELWDSAAGCASGRSCDALAVNAAIEKMRGRINKYYSEIRSDLGFVTAELIKNSLTGIAQKPATLMTLFDEHNQEFSHRVGVDRSKEMYALYLLSYRHLQVFLRKEYGADDMPLISLTPKFYDAYDLFLRTDCGLQQRTLSEHIIILKKMTRRAVAQGTLRCDPFHNLSPEQPPKVSRHTSLEELQWLMSYIPERENLRRVRDWFIFSTFTGLAYADLRRLSEEHILRADDGSLCIDFNRKKTGTNFRVRLLPVALQIMEKYRAERIGGLIFNVYSREYMHILVRKLGDLCGISGLTFHRARHNFGTHITLSMGVPIESVSRMMGHTSITTTQIYARVTDKKIDEDMKRLREKINICSHD